MPGPYVTDLNAPNLLAGSTLTAAGSTNGTIAELDWVHGTTFVLTTATATGTSPTLDITIQGSESSTFATGVVTLGRFSQATAAGAVLELTTFVDSKFVRAVVVPGGTTPSFAGSTLVPQLEHYNRTRLNSAAP